LLELAYPAVIRHPSEDWLAHLRRLETVHASGSRPEPCYSVTYRLLNAADYGLPQTRARVFIVGFRSDTELVWRFPEPTHSLDALLRDQWVTGGYWERHGLSRPETPADVLAKLPQLARYELLPKQPWATTRDAISDLPEPCADKEPFGIMNH